MDRQQIGLKLALDALALPVRMQSFEERLVLQKAIHLSQAAGVQLGYHYNWYLRGPYSPALTRDAFAVVAELNQGEDESQGYNLDSTSLQRLQKMRDLISRIPRQELGARLELLASVCFLLKKPAGHGKNAPQLQATMQRFGKSYTAGEIEDAIKELKHHGLCPPNSAR